MARINRTIERLHRYTAGTLKPATIGSWANYHRISRRTATRDLKALHEAGLIDVERHEKNNGIGYEYALVVYPGLNFMGGQDE